MIKIEISEPYKNRAEEFFISKGHNPSTMKARPAKTDITNHPIPFLEITATIDGVETTYTELFALDYFIKDDQ